MPLDRNEITYKRCNGEIETTYTALKDDANVIALNSGVIIYLSNYSVSESAISFKKKALVVDINGLKGPNKIGRDLFFFHIDGESGMIVPRATDDAEPATFERSRTQLINGPSTQNYQCNKNGRGMWCAALIIRDGWRIKDDYPW